MKRTKEELTNSVNSLDIDEDVKIALIEDIADSFVESSGVSQEEYDELDSKYNELRQKYKDRFLGVADEKKESPEEKNEDEEIKEEEVIDIKEI